MTPLTSLLLPIALSAVAAFVLTMVIHMTPWHKGDYVQLPDEDGVRNALRPFNIPPNDYMVPHPRSGDYMRSKEYDEKLIAGPVVVMTVAPSGPWPLGKSMGLWFLFCLVAAAAVACVVGKMVPPGGEVFRPIAFVTFLTHAMGAVPLSIWYQRKWSTTLRYAIDAVLFSAASGWIFSMMWPK